MQSRKPFLLNLPTDLFDRLAVAATEQNVTFTHFIRQSITRNLNYYETRERPVFRRLAEEGMRV